MQKMSLGFICFFDGKRLVKHLLGRMLRNVKDGSFLQVAVSAEEALEVLRQTSKDGGIVSEKILSIRTAYGSDHLMSGPIHCS